MRRAPARLVLLGTGGTIAATAGHANELTDYRVTEDVDAMLAAVPGAQALGAIRCEQIFNIDSRQFTTAGVLRLARRIRALLRDPEIDGLVVTHGTDTLEETAFLLHLTIRHPKPVVLVGAMRPGSALSADGPLNLYNALLVARDPRSRDCGILVAMNDRILAARHATKGHTTRVDAFGAEGPGVLGWISDGAVRIVQRPILPPAAPFPLTGLRKLPRVDILYDHQDAGDHLYQAAIDAGVEGIVVAGLGNGSLSPAALRGCARARRRGIQCIRASRVPYGEVTVKASDDEDGILASRGLNPQQARTLLRLALARGLDTTAIGAALREL
ncbi:asparaginase [Castellaniella sp. GW247-6E4]|uniref:asparaginase n=1 Tax=Castellaniella sp. GW247-6E4 TaxID=3140380 RepID=UPI003314F094